MTAIAGLDDYFLLKRVILSLIAGRKEAHLCSCMRLFASRPFPLPFSALQHFITTALALDRIILSMHSGKAPGRLSL
jgi:hypothetical protein